MKPNKGKWKTFFYISVLIKFSFTCHYFRKFHTLKLTSQCPISYSIICVRWTTLLISTGKYGKGWGCLQREGGSCLIYPSFMDQWWLFSEGSQGNASRPGGPGPLNFPEPSTLKKPWASKVPPKIFLFIWKTMRNWVASKTKEVYPNPVCPVCRTEESNDHWQMGLESLEGQTKVLNSGGRSGTPC